MACLSAVCLLQVWQMWLFITFHLKHNREVVENASTGPDLLAQYHATKQKHEIKNKGMFCGTHHYHSVTGISQWLVVTGEMLFRYSCVRGSTFCQKDAINEVKTHGIRAKVM